MAVEKKNIFLQNTKNALEYSSPRRPIGTNFPVRPNVRTHGEFIQQRIKNSYERSADQKRAAAIKYKNGTYLEFSSESGYDLALKSLENIRQGIRILNVREDLEKKITKATVYVPGGKEKYFVKKIEEYIEKTTDKGKPKNNDLISSIEDISLALLDAFWIGKVSDMPVDNARWCEVWLRFDAKKTEELTNDNKMKAIKQLTDCCEALNISLNESEIVFPERIVKLIYVNKTQLRELITICDYIAEFRRSPEQLNFFEELSGSEQQEWITDLLKRTNFDIDKTTICLLDTGLNSKHPLISPTVKSENVIQAVEGHWGSDDHAGHGTEMAGIAIYNDLKEKLVGDDLITINHGIESVKILPQDESNDPTLYGEITMNAVYLSEIENPDALRTICMAVTSPDYNTDDGSPTSWSAAIDKITSGADGDGNRRLFFVSGGNVHPIELTTIPYPKANITHSVENPGQSWNAITVGAYCNDIDVSSAVYKGFHPVADVGELSPYSSTSKMWNNKWPVKPEILLNGGNMVTNESDYDSCDDLALLTTSKDVLSKPLSTIWGTSSATAQASWMASQIYNEYPDIWPETVRGLLIHSASWTEKMIEQFCQEDKKTKGRRQLLRTCGYGIPNLNKALECANNSVNLIIQSELQPFVKNSMNEMHIHTLPWPREVLESLGEVEAKLKVTLSYFIEPGPGEIGWKNKYRYPSCGLRFDVINSNENLDDFEKRINVKMRGEDQTDSGDGSSRDWYLGKDNRDVGSIHSDFCSVSAVDLCDANFIAVYPVIGWWRERGYLGKFNEKVKYSLVVSLETPRVDVDLYTSIINQIDIEQEIEIDLPSI
ncbi:S8 family peptidase [Oceanobacillus sojae]|uniref:S8 family peptidase n=1 Tax=Oceanobacillus sojae TaxID=582851 RepID=UPI0021A96549|nr:S8 family peptidase [Oceanobacillus sojae]MCT1903530.1 S8 family peptidase [Oceanobacillus sojae]